jgi:hypothetical protein
VINYRNKPKGQYIQEALWQDLYELAQQWKNTLEFQLFEIEFLQNLIDRYFVDLLLEENLDELREIQRDLYQSENKSKILLERIDVHLNHITKTIETPDTFDALQFRNDHELLEDHTTASTRIHKTMKITTFKMIEDVLQNDTPKFI